MIKETYIVPKISCNHCTATIERELNFVEGVRGVEAHEESKRVEVQVENEGVLSEVEALLEEIGYPAEKAAA